MWKDILFVWKPNVEDNIGPQREAIGTFVCPCIFSKIVIDDQQDATFLFIYSHSALYVSGDVKLALTSPTGGGRSVGIVRSRTKATEFSLV